MTALQSSRTLALTPLDRQRTFWGEWNRAWRLRDRPDEFMKRQVKAAIYWANAAGLSNAAILDIGCGTGWLGNRLTGFGHVTGIDLSPDAIAEGSRRYPKLTLVAGDLFTAALPNQSRRFDFIVSSGVIACVEDQAGFIERVAELLRPGGTLLLMSVNPFVWRRRSALKPVKVGQIRKWLRLKELRSLLRRDFAIRHISTIEPGGDRGVLWWVENGAVLALMDRMIGRERWNTLLERMHLGRELVVVAQRSRRTAATTAEVPRQRWPIPRHLRRS